MTAGLTTLRAMSLLFSLVVAVTAAWLIWQATGWPWKSALFPIGTSAIMLVLSLWQAARETARIVSGSAVEPQGRVIDLQADDDLPVAAFLRRAGIAWLWILGLLAAIYLVGFVLAIPLYVALYLFVQARCRLVTSLGLAVAWLVLTILIFEFLLHTRWLVPVFEGPQDFALDMLHRYVGTGL